MKTMHIEKHSHDRAALFSFPTAGRDHIKGPIGASVQLLQYGDYRCRNCATIYATIKELQHYMGDDLCFAFRHCPAGRSHPNGNRPAEVAEAAGKQGKFWQMHDLLLENHEALTDEDLARYAKMLGLDAARAMREVFKGWHSFQVQQDILAGRAMGVAGSPVLFVNGQPCENLIGFCVLLEDAKECSVPIKSTSTDRLLRKVKRL